VRLGKTDGPENAETIFDKWASAQGVVRPFVALANMQHEERLLIAEELAVSLNSAVPGALTHALRDLKMAARPPSSSEEGLVAQAEACLIIGQDGKGLQARAHSAFQTLNPIGTNFTWREILVAVAEDIGAEIADGNLSEPALEETIVAAARKAAGEDFSSEQAERLYQSILRWLDRLSPGLPKVLRWSIEGALKIAVKGGFRTYIAVVKAGSLLNKLPFVRLPMSLLTWGFKRALIVVNWLLWLLVLYDLLEMAFGHSRSRLVGTIVAVHQFYEEEGEGK
jgi:hypothetical protein